MKRNLLTIMLAFLVVFGVNAQKQVITAQKRSTPVERSMQKKDISINKEATAEQIMKFQNNMPKERGSVVIGTGTTAMDIPINMFYGYSISQQIYLQSEINEAGNITQVAFYYGEGSNNFAGSNDWQIFIGHTAKTQFDNTTDWIDFSTLTEVYNSTFTVTGNGWVVFDLSAPFNYNNTDNLVIGVLDNKSGYDGSGDNFFGSTTTNSRNINQENDGSAYDPFNPPTADALDFNLANVTLTIVQPVALDATITGISTPVDGFATTTTDITANLLNLGTTDMTACNINYNVYDVTNAANVTSGTFAWTGTLSTGNSEDVVVGNFTSTLNTTYTITVTSDLTGDEDATNDEFVKDVSSRTIFSVPYTQDFESAGAMPDNWVNNTADDDDDWEITQAIGHGASVDHTTGTGYYVGLDDSEGVITDGDVAILETPWFNTTTLTAPLMKFYFQNIDDGTSGVVQVTPLHVDVYNGTDWVEDVLVITEEVNEWTEYSVILSAYSNASLKVRFRGVGIGTDWFSDLSVDDFSITEAPANDLAVTNITPTWIYANDNFVPEVTIVNMGGSDQTSYDVTIHNITGTYNETITITETIASGGTYTVTTLPAWENVPAGTDTLTAVVTTIIADEVPDNNTMVVGFNALDFENYTEGTIYSFNVADWSGSGFEYHIVNVNTTDATMSDVGESGVSGMYCGDFIDGTLVGIADTIVYGIANNGTAVEFARITGLDDSALGLTWDAAANKTYVSTLTKLYAVNDNDEAVLAGAYTTTTTMMGIASDIDGNLYGISLDDNLYSIDKATGAETVIGPLGVDISYAQDIGFDRTNGILYGTLYLGGGTGGLYTIDIATGTATQVGSDFEDELTMCAVFYERPVYTVTFTVDDGTTPLENVSIAINGETLTTDATGIATIDLVNGDYPYTATIAGCDTYSGTITVNDDVVAEAFSMNCPSIETDILTYSFAEQTGDATIDAVNHTVAIEVASGTDVTTLVATFTLSDGAATNIGGINQESTTTANDFTNDVIYNVIAEDGSTNQDWTITVNIATGINTLNTGISIYPNPSNGVFTISVNDNFNLEVIDVTGRVINALNVNSNSTLNISEAGVYFLRFSNENGTTVKRVVVK